MEYLNLNFNLFRHPCKTSLNPMGNYDSPLQKPRKPYHQMKVFPECQKRLHFKFKHFFDGATSKSVLLKSILL